MSNNEIEGYGADTEILVPDSGRFTYGLAAAGGNSTSPVVSTHERVAPTLKRYNDEDMDCEEWSDDEVDDNDDADKDDADKDDADKDDSEVVPTVEEMYRKNKGEDRREERQAKATAKRLERRKIRMEEEVEDCIRWFNQGERRYRAPVPRFLLLEDAGKRRYTKEDVMRRTAWMGQELGIRSRELLPEMRRLTIKGKEVIAIKADDPAIAKKLLAMRSVGPCKVEITKDPQKNRSYGVFKDFGGSLNNSSEEGIKHLLNDEGVVEVHRFTTWKNKVQIPTQSYKLTFDALICPSGVTIEGEYYRVSEFVPPPLRCYKCQKYDHMTHKCRKTEYVCQRCGEIGHQSREYVERRLVSSCTKPMKCVHCNGPHEAGHRDCPAQKDHRKVNELMILQKLSRQEARERVRPSGNRSTDAQTVVASSQRRENEELARKAKEQKDKEAIESLTKKVDALLEKVGVTTPAAEVGLEDRLRRELSTQVDARFDELDRRLQDQDKKLKDQETVIRTLSNENEILRKEKEKEKREKEALKKELQNLKESRKRTGSDHSSDHKDKKINIEKDKKSCS